MATIKTNVNVRIDSYIKEQATQLLGRMGLDQTTAIDMFYRQIIAERRLPFQPIITPTLDEQLVALLERTPAREYTLDLNDKGELLIDKDSHPELHDWAVNG
jgi:DNA-damage-inducible protein J